MKRALTALAFCAFAGLGLGAVAPAAQASAFSAGASAATVSTAVEKTNLVEVQYRDRRWDHRRHWRRDWDRDRRWRRPRSGIYFEFGTGGFRYGPPPYYARPRYVRPRYVAPRRAGISSAHVNWCYAQYRSYRAWDNTFQPYYGPRRVCVSPYWR